VLLHELCHLRHHDHGHAFHLLLEHVLTDNLIRKMDDDAIETGVLMRKIAASKAKYPADHVMTREIRNCKF
jgi:predicted metal-dependent hydrolase